MAESPRAAWRRESPRVWVVFAASTVFVFGTLASYPLTSRPGVIPQLSAGLGAGIAGALFWWVLIERPSKPTLLRGVVFGALTVIVAHPLMLVMLVLLAGVEEFILQSPGTAGLPVWGVGPSLVELPDLFIEVVRFTPVMLAVGGFITVPIGITAGLVLVALRRRLPNDSVAH